MPFDAATIGALFTKFKGGATAAGNAISGAAGKMTNGASGLDIASAGLGLLGGMNFMSAKKPTISRPELLTSVAPVQNYEADRNLGQNQIAQNASSAMNNVRSQLGGDWASYASAALGVNAQSNQAAQTLNAGIGAQKRQDNIATAQQINQDREFNFTTQRSFDEAQHNQSMEAYQGQRTQGAGMMQGALNYMVGKDASNRAFAEKQKMAEQIKQGTMMEHILKNGTMTQKDDILRENGLGYMVRDTEDMAAGAMPTVQGAAPQLNVNFNPQKVNAPDHLTYRTPSLSAPAVNPTPSLAPSFTAPKAAAGLPEAPAPGINPTLQQSLYSKKPGTKSPFLNNFNFQFPQ